MYKNAENPTPKKNGNTQFKRLPFSTFETRVEPDYPVHFINNKRFMGNFCFLKFLQQKKEMKNNKHFVMDARDEARWKAEKVKPLFFLLKLENFVSKYPDKNLYIRNIKSDKKEYFFADEVLELIPLVLQQQGTPLSLFDQRIHELRKEYESNCCSQANIITMEKVEEILELYDVDKSFVTIIPDYDFLFRKTLHYNNMDRHVSHTNLSFSEMLLPKQAIYHLFWRVVCEVNWNMNYCVEHPNCRLDCIELIVTVMRQFLDWGEGKMITLRFIHNCTDQLMHTCHMQRAFEEQNDESNHLQTDKYPDDTMSYRDYLLVCQTFGLLPGNLAEYGEKPNGYRVWLVRGLLMCGWIQSFFRGAEHDDLKQVIFDEMRSFMPEGNPEVITKGLRKVAFAPYDEDFNKIENAIEVKKLRKLAADRERRNQQIQEKRQKSKNKENPKMKEEKPKPVAEKVETKMVKNDEQKEWKDYSEDNNLELENGTITIGPHQFTSNRNILQFENIESCDSPYFLLDWKQWTTKCSAMETFSKYWILNSLKLYSNHFDNIVVRSIKTTTGNYVLTSEMLRLIGALLEKQGIPVEQYYEKWKTYMEKWASEDPEVFYSVEVSFFKIIMSSFNVDTNLLTIVPDYSHYRSSHKSDFDTNLVTTEISGGGNRKRIMSKDQAIFHIFQSIICGVNWDTKNCRKNKKIVDDFRKKYFEETEKLMNMRKGTFVTQKFVEDSIAALRHHPVFTNKIAHSIVDYEFLGFNPEAIMPRENYTKQADFFHLPSFNSKSRLKDVTVWLARTWMRMGWIESFYQDEMLETKLVLAQELGYHVPSDIREQQVQSLTRIIRARSENLENENDWRELQKLTKLVNNPTVLKQMQKTEKPVESKKLDSPPPEGPTGSVEISENSENTRPSSVPLLESVEPTEPTISPQEPPQKPKKAPKKPKPCTKCTENGVALCNAREVLKKSEILAKHNETKAKKVEKVEANLEKMMLKMKELEEEIENLNGDLKNFDVKEKQLKEENKEVLKDIGNLEEQVEREKHKNAEINQRNLRIKEKFDEVQLELVTRKSEQEAMESKGKGKGRRDPTPSTSSNEPSTFHVPFIPSIPTTDDPELARNPKWVLEQWKTMKTNFQTDEMVDDERKMIEDLLSKSDKLELDVRNLVEYELHQFNATCRIYLQNIDLNIMKIEKTEDISGLRPLAKYPTLSTEFQNVYEKYMGENY